MEGGSVARVERRTTGQACCVADFLCYCQQCPDSKTSYASMNLCQYLTATARTQPERILCICGHRRTTAAELLARVSALANALASDLAVQPGDAVALAAYNSDMYMEVVLAVMAIGAVIAPVNWRWSLQVRTMPVHAVPEFTATASSGACAYRRMRTLHLKLAAPSS